jgi:hypothetical protein
MQLIPSKGRFSLKIRLSDFIDTPDETYLLEALEKVKDKFMVPVVLKLWFVEDELQDKKVKKFMSTHTELLSHYNTNIYYNKALFCKSIGGDGIRESDAWFNVVNEIVYLEEGHTNSRFNYVYSNEAPIWTCVHAFLDTVNFHAKERPIYNKKQGRFN